MTVKEYRHPRGVPKQEWISLTYLQILPQNICVARLSSFKIIEKSHKNFSFHNTNKHKLSIITFLSSLTFEFCFFFFQKVSVFFFNILFNNYTPKNTRWCIIFYNSSASTIYHFERYHTTDSIDTRTELTTMWFV